MPPIHAPSCDDELRPRLGPQRAQRVSQQARERGVGAEHQQVAVQLLLR